MVKAFSVSSKKEDVSAKVEKKRDRGGGFLKKKSEEKLAYLRLLLFPCVAFDFQYLKKKGLMGGKTPHRSHTIFLTEPEIIWAPELSKEMKEKGLQDVSEGFYIPLEQSQAETLATTHFGLMRSGRVSREQVRQAMNIDAEPDDLQTPVAISVVYLPYWVAKLETPEVTRYLVYNRDGKEDEKMTGQMNTNYDFVLDLERRASEI